MLAVAFVGTSVCLLIGKEGRPRTLHGPWYGAEDCPGPHAGIEDVVGSGVDARPSDRTRALSAGHSEVEVATADADQTRLVATCERCAANLVGVWVETVRESGAIKGIDSVMGEGADPGNIVATARSLGRDAHGQSWEDK